MPLYNGDGQATARVGADKRESGEDHLVAKAKNERGQDRRAKGTDRRGKERRKESVAVVVERRIVERRKVQRRRQIDPTTCERDYTAEEIEFMQAMDAYKRSSGRMFPTCSEILEVLRDLGYQRSHSQGSAAAGEGSSKAPSDERTNDES
jgi:hypothetical protein